MVRGARAGPRWHHRGGGAPGDGSAWCEDTRRLRCGDANTTDARADARAMASPGNHRRGMGRSAAQRLGRVLRGADARERPREADREPVRRDLAVAVQHPVDDPSLVARVRREREEPGLDAQRQARGARERARRRWSVARLSRERKRGGDPLAEPRARDASSRVEGGLTAGVRVTIATAAQWRCVAARRPSHVEIQGAAIAARSPLSPPSSANPRPLAARVESLVV